MSMVGGSRDFIDRWPKPHCVYIVQVHEHDAIKGSRYQNPVRSWGVVQDGMVHFEDKRLKKVKSWAEKRWPQIKGWKVEKTNLHVALLKER